MSRMEDGDLEEYKFKVYSFHPEQFTRQFYRLFDEEREKGNLHYTIGIEETAPPPELVKEILYVTAASLSILKILYDFYKETRKKKGRIIINLKDRTIDMKDIDIDELRVLIESESKEEK